MVCKCVDCAICSGSCCTAAGNSLHRLCCAASVLDRGDTSSVALLVASKAAKLADTGYSYSIGITDDWLRRSHVIAALWGSGGTVIMWADLQHEAAKFYPNQCHGRHLCFVNDAKGTDHEAAGIMKLMLRKPDHYKSSNEPVSRNTAGSKAVRTECEHKTMQ